MPAYLPDHPEIRWGNTQFYDALAILDHQVGEGLEALDASGFGNKTYVIYLTEHGRGHWRESVGLMLRESKTPL